VYSVTLRSSSSLTMDCLRVSSWVLSKAHGTSSSVVLPIASRAACALDDMLELSSSFTLGPLQFSTPLHRASRRRTRPPAPRRSLPPLSAMRIAGAPFADSPRQRPSVTTVDALFAVGQPRAKRPPAGFPVACHRPPARKSDTRGPLGRPAEKTGAPARSQQGASSTRPRRPRVRTSAQVEALTRPPQRAAPR
jgi:hypothetical protein